MAIRIEWDKYEVALLIYACELVLGQKIPKQDVITWLSYTLRLRAMKNGIEIDDVFRNENGISLQMTKMTFLLTDGESGLPGASKLYASIAELKKDNLAEFTQILKEATEQIGGKEVGGDMSHKDAFVYWLSSNPLKKYSTDTIISTLEIGSAYCCSHGICQESFWEINDVVKFISVSSKLLEMRMFRITHKNTLSETEQAIRLYKIFLTSHNVENTFVSQNNEIIDEPEVLDKSEFLANDTIRHNDSVPSIYQKLISISKVYDDPSGISISKIVSLLGKDADELLIKKILDGADWATKLSDDIYSFSRVNPPKITSIESCDTNITGIVTASSFYKYLHDELGMLESTCHSYVSAIKAAESFAKFNHVKPYNIFDCAASEATHVIHTLLHNAYFSISNAQQQGRFSAAFEVFLEFIDQTLIEDTTPIANENSIHKVSSSDFKMDRFEQVLLTRYRNGMQFDSIDYEIFRETYNDLFNEELLFDDTALEERLRLCGVIYQDRVFPAEGIIDSQTKEILFEYIDNSFLSGKKVLYYKAIFDDLSDTFANCFLLSNEKMLRAYIEFTAEKDKYYFHPCYMAAEKNISIDHNAEVEEYLLSVGKPMAINDVCAALSHIPKEQVDHIIKTDGRFLRNAKGIFFHVDIFEVSSAEIERITDIINAFIEQNEFAVWTDVWNEIQSKMPVFLENNPYLSRLGIRNCLAKRFRGKFTFESAVISLPKDRYAMKDIYKLYAKHRSEFTADDVYHLSKELDTTIYFEALAVYSVRVSSDLFVSKERIHFDVDAVDSAIESYMSKDYIRIREIDSFLVFPNVGFEWNEYLLESFVYSYSKKFALLNNGFSLGNVAGAVVKKACSIHEFIDACAVILADAPIPLNSREALNYLAEVNMITRRSYREIDSALTKAAQIRAKKG